MNLNQSLVNKKRFRSKNAVGITTFKTKQIMGAPNKPAPKRKTSSTPSSATNWGRSHLSVFNNSILRSGSTTLSTDTESRIIIALTEGRGDARCEVGMASIDLSLPTLILCQISDAQSYINTLTKINILNPTDIVIPATFLESIHNRLVDKIKKQFPKIKILSAPRKTFNKSNGMDRILQLCLPSINTICVGLQHKYYALAAASALVTYLQNNLNIYYANESLNVNYQESEGYAVIDVSTADRLELVSSTKPTQATRYSSLFGVLNYCSTKIGARLLRSTILQPPCLPAIIEQTTRCVTELIKHPQMLLSIQVILQKISNIDQLLGITTKNFGTSDSCSVRQLNYLLLLNSLIDLIDPLKGIIERCEQPFFKDLKNTLESDKFNVIANQIRSMIHPSAQFLKNEAGINQRCYAIKSGINGLLDLVRKTYSERLNDMTEYVKYLGNKYNLPLTLGNNNTKGYHIVLKLNNQQKRFFKKTDLPPEFIQVYRLAGSCTMKTAELINYSTRLEDIMLEILKISNVMIHKTMIELKQHIGFFYKLCEDIARLDMLQSLAEASRRGSYVRPKFGEFTELIQARHPMLELLIGNQRVANSISICKDFNIHIITGPNGSGKSIYIRQVILLQVMAQVGCYVPADSAIFRPMSRMFARIYLEDNMEYGASAFILEMKEIKYMMTLLSENSLFIIDELCRSTSADEGTALAMAICEKFCSTSAFVFVTTHYTALANLAHMYLNVKTWQMEIVSSGDSPQDFNLNYKFRLIPGVTTSKHYGVYIVRNIWPESILEEVYKILDNLKNASVNKKFIGVHKAIKLKYKLESDLRKLESRKQLSGAEINKLLNNYQNELQKLNINLDFDYRNAQFGSDFVPCGNGGQELINDEAGSILNFTFDKPLNGCSIFETSSYKNLSNFLREDSDNINKLIPEITIACSGREFNTKLDVTLNSATNSNNVSNTTHSSQSYEKHSTPVHSELEYIENSMEIEEMNKLNFEVSRNQDFDKNQNRIQSSIQTVWGVNDFDNNVNDIDLESLMEDLESCNESFFSDDSFNFSQASSYQTAVSAVAPEKDQKYEHIIPIVTIINGPNWDSDSSSCNTSTGDDDEKIQESFSQPPESISYSPLCSPSRNVEVSGSGSSKNDDQTVTGNKRSNQSNAQDTSSSSLHFIVRSDKEPNENSVNAATTTDTNLENISMNRGIDNITVDNLKSNSVTTAEKPSSKSESNDDDSKMAQTASSSLKESDKSNEGGSKKKIKNKKKKMSEKTNFGSKQSRKFIPPKKLTKKEIEEEFLEQDRKIYETDISNSDFSKYLSQVLKRPSVKQVQKSKHLAFVRRTEQGVEVIPAEPEPLKKPKMFRRNLSCNSNVDVSIFSDKNAKCFDDFLNSNERDVKRFKFNLDSEPNSNPVKNQQFNFQPQSISDYAVTDGNVQFSFRRESSIPFSQNFCDNIQSLTPVTPDGYYRQNKEDINNMIDKYLQDDGKPAEAVNRNLQNVFETCSFTDNDLEL